MILGRDVIFYIFLSPCINHYFCMRLKTSKERLTELLVPDVLPEIPREICKVHYEPNLTIHVGDTVYWDWIGHAPKVTWNCNPTEFYCLIMTDPERHYKYTHRKKCYHNWLVVDIPGCDIDQGTVYYDYFIPRPYFKLDIKYEILSIFQQLPERPPLPMSSEQYYDAEANTRSDFTVKQFAARYTTGVPVAANYFKMNGSLCKHLAQETTKIYPHPQLYKVWLGEAQDLEGPRSKY